MLQKYIDQHLYKTLYIIGSTTNPQSVLPRISEPSKVLSKRTVRSKWNLIIQGRDGGFLNPSKQVGASGIQPPSFHMSIFGRTSHPNNICNVVHQLFFCVIVILFLSDTVTTQRIFRVSGYRRYRKLNLVHLPQPNLLPPLSSSESAKASGPDSN